MTIDWARLRALHGDRRDGFEELCCQLAHRELVPEGSVFTRKGRPDAGVECFWRFSNGEEWAWQAKFFLEALKPKQWSDIKESFEAAVAEHPNLTKYFVCLPRDLSSGKSGRGKSELTHWDAHRKSWIARARSKGVQVEIVLWNSHELTSRLQSAEMHGMRCFWFDEPHSFSPKWFEDRVRIGVRGAGNRYTPELNVDLPLAEAFDGLGRTPRFSKSIRGHAAELARLTSHVSRGTLADLGAANADHIVPLATDIIDSLRALAPRSDQASIPADVHLDWGGVNDLIKQARSALPDLMDAIDQRSREESRALQKQPGSRDQSRFDFAGLRYSLVSMGHKIEEIAEFVCSKIASLANLPVMVLTGIGGTGKTHLLCDVAESQTALGLPRLLLHAGHFEAGDPWEQVIKKLGLSISRDVFLDALSAAGEAYGSRVVILIDAINEGGGLHLWPHQLASFIAELEHRPWIGLCVSLRESYRGLLLEHVRTKDYVLCAHRGFDEVSERAVEQYFEHYGLTPSVPVMDPELQVPLFLKIFCETLQRKGITAVPPGHHGLSTVFDEWLGAINHQLSEARELDFDPAQTMVQRAVSGLIDLMIKRDSDRLALEEARALVDGLLPRNGHSRSFFLRLVSAGVLLRECGLRAGDSEFVSLGYQRFGDFELAKRLLDLHAPDPTTAASAFSATGALGARFADEHRLYSQQGLVEAFTVLVPERFGTELAEMVPWARKWQPLREAFCGMLTVRRSDSITDGTRKFIHEVVSRNEYDFAEFLDGVVRLIAVPDHPFNGRWLSQFLRRFAMPDRDAWWSTFLHQNWSADGATCRLVEWTLATAKLDGLVAESLECLARGLVWFLTASNRFVRDRATKALVRLLDSRLDVVEGLLMDLGEVDDPYVTERLYAVAYGCAMRHRDPQKVSRLAMRVYQSIFEHGRPPAQLLLRDYARGVCELAVHLVATTPIDLVKIRPPYASSWPGIKLLTKKTVERRLSECSKDPGLGTRRLISSTSNTFEDFACHEVRGFKPWTRHSRRRRRPPTLEEQYQSLMEGIAREGQQLLRNLESAYRGLSMASAGERVAGLLKREASRTLSVEQATEGVREAERQVKEYLRKHCRDGDGTFKRVIKPYLTGSPAGNEGFDVEIGFRWLLTKITRLGWTASRFEEFDERVVQMYDRGRGARKPERMGKKYQWIALDELRARLADNFHVRSESHERAAEAYEGPWESPSARDIDPSSLLEDSPKKRKEGSEQSWWFPAQSIPWREIASDLDWIAHTADVPNPRMLLAPVATPRNHPLGAGTLWIILSGSKSWDEPVLRDSDEDNVDYRQIVMSITGFLIPSARMAKFGSWAAREKFYGRDIPDAASCYHRFLGEFHWAPAYADWRAGLDRDRRVSRGYRGIGFPEGLIIPDETYVHEGGDSLYDCSVTNTVSLNVPSREIAKELSLVWSGKEGLYLDKSRRPTAVDPTGYEVGPGALMLRLDALKEFLENRELELVWIVTGEKRVMLASMRQEDYPGRLGFSGYYRWTGTEVVGKLNFYHEPPSGKSGRSRAIPLGAKSVPRKVSAARKKKR